MKPGKGRIRLISAVPGAGRKASLVSKFAESGPGLVTSFSERQLRIVSSCVESETLEVLPFAEVVSRFMVVTGGASHPVAAGGLALEALAAACGDLPSESHYYRSSRFPGTHKALLRTLRELHEADIDLAKVAAASPNPRLAALAFLDLEMRRKLEALGRAALSDLIDESVGCVSPEAKLGRLLVLADSDICARNLRWIRWAAECGADVTVVLESHAGGQPFFTVSDRARRLLAQEAESTSVENGLLQRLFHPESNSGAAAPEVVCVKAPDRLAECEWAIRGCLEARATGVAGARIAIYARNLDEYSPLLEASGKRLQLPLSLARRVPLLSNRFAKLLLEILGACAGTDVRPLLGPSRSTYLGLPLDRRSTFQETLSEAFRQGEGQWSFLADWAQTAGDDWAWVRALLSWRQDALCGRSSLKEWIGRLRALVDALPTNPFDDTATSARDARAQNALQRSLYPIASVDPERYAEMTLPEFERLCRRVWSAADVSVPESEGIAVCDSAEGLGDLDVLFVLGMLEGVFPRRRAEDPILSDEDRAEIASITGTEWLRDSHDKAREERQEFYRVCAAAGLRLVFSYPETDDQRDNVPAFYLREVCRAAGIPYDPATYSRTMQTPEASRCLASADRALADALAAERLSFVENTLETPEARAAVSWHQGRPITPKELSEVLECPFRFFVRRQLNLRTHRSASRWSGLRRLPQRARLYGQPDEASATTALEAALQRELDELAAEAPSWEVAMLRAGGKRLIRDWIKREFAARKRWPKKEHSLRPEVTFEDEGFRAAVASGLRLGGGVAAASEMGPYKVSHLFEARAPERDRDTQKLEDPEFVYYGLHLLAQYEPGQGSALEVETMGERTLYILPRLAGSAYPGDVANDLRVIDLSSKDDAKESLSDFFTELKRKTNVALAKIRNLEVEAQPGAHCQWCDLGELCRKSREFGEGDPFDVFDD